MPQNSQPVPVATVSKFHYISPRGASCFHPFWPKHLSLVTTSDQINYNLLGEGCHLGPIAKRHRAGESVRVIRPETMRTSVN